VTFAAELDDVRQQIRQEGTTTIRFWPSVAGSGNVLITGTPTFSILKDTTTAISTGNATATTVDGITKISISIDASDKTVWELRENYAAIITWAHGGETHVSTVRFDCVLEPVTDLNITLNDFIEEVVDMDERLERQAAIQAAGRTAEQAASLLAVKAWGDVRRWLKANAESTGGFLPRLIIDREGLRRVVIARAISRAYRADGGGPDSESYLLHEDWLIESQARFKELGPLAYDSNEDRIEDSTIGSWATVRTRRTW